MITSKTKRTALIGASILTAVLCAGCSCRDEDAQRKAQEQQAQEQQDEQPKQAEKEAEDTNKRGLRVDPLGKFTTPGRCVGSICF